MVSISAERRALGERLKRHRERRGVALEAISQSTKIPVSLFAGLERGDCSRWPVGLYSRAYVRAYADAIGVNADDAVEDFIAAFGSSVQPEGTEGAHRPAPRAAGALRLGLVDEPGVDLSRLARRTAWAAGDLAIASGIAWSVHALLDTSLLVTAGSGLLYHVVSRIVSDEPLLAWIAHHARTAPAEPDPVEGENEVGVASAASTTA
jgi:hypothetical protein